MKPTRLVAAAAALSLSLVSAAALADEPNAPVASPPPLANAAKALPPPPDAAIALPQVWVPSGEKPVWAPPSYAGAQRAWEPLPPLRREKRWYGWQILAAVGVSDALILLGATTNNRGATGGLIIAGVMGHGLAGPIVHAAHRQWGRTGVSIGLNLGLPALGALTGWGLSASTCTESSSGFLGCGFTNTVFAALGGIVGSATATVIDVSALAYEDKHPNRHAQGKAPPFTFSVSPLVGQGRAGLGVGGQF